MKKNYVAMGEYYRDSHGLIRTVCRATDCKTGEVMIVYVNINDNGFAGDPMLMSEAEFKDAFPIGE